MELRQKGVNLGIILRVLINSINQHRLTNSVLEKIAKLIENYSQSGNLIFVWV